ncbi:MAG: hypothetical protein EDQ89_04490 [Acidobacteria bacterium]|nr:MAG: hypothetical protein EDQ89_04490 [Acidobacteriota bacterium]
MIAAITDASQEALDILRDGSTFSWTTVTLLAFAFYVYAVEIERRRWDIILAGVAFFLMDVFNELVNSAILHASDRSALWTVTGDTSYLILVGWCIEIVFLFLVTGIIFVKQLPPDPRTRILGVPNRVFLVLAFSLFCVLVEVFLESTGYFHWDYWWWNVPFVPLIVIFGYATFFAIAAYVHDLGPNRRKQLRIVGGMATIDATLAVGLGLAGWL